MQHYRYAHTQTEATTGYFSCEPVPPLSLDRALEFLAEHPLDDFMRRHILARMAAMPAPEVRAALARACGMDGPPPAVAALEQEWAVLHPDLRDLAPDAALSSPAPDSGEDAQPAGRGPGTDATPLILLRWRRLPDSALHTAWGALFADNIQRHRALKAPADTGLPPLYPEEALQNDGSGRFFSGRGEPLPGLSAAFAAPFPHSIESIRERKDFPAPGGASSPAAPSAPDLPPGEVAALAEERLARQGIIAGKEMRHTASLSPVALLRPWKVSLRVRRDRHEHTLEGQATTYGRGLALDAARASCLMEMVERASVYLSIDGDRVENRLEEAPVVRGSRSALLEKGLSCLDPNDFPLEAPYGDEPLSWMPGHDPAGNTVHVPVQMASLFCNLDEISLFDSPGSTGIATGLTLEAAKRAALTEIIERDAEASTPFSKSGCFTLRADGDPLLARLMGDYAARGINVQFQDLTGPLGVPAYKCFVMGPKGDIARGHGAGLSAKRALISALTETPFPYPGGGPSGPLLRKLAVRDFADFPDWSTGSPSGDLALLEALLASSGRPPVYVTLTRADLQFPVVRAFVPGFALAADSDAFTRVPLRLYKNYLALFSG